MYVGENKYSKSRERIYYDVDNDQFYLYQVSTDTLTRVGVDGFSIQYLVLGRQVIFIGKGDIRTEYGQYSPASGGYPQYAWPYPDAMILSPAVKAEELYAFELYGFKNNPEVRSR